MRRKALLVTLAAAIAAGCGEGPDKPREPGSLSASARITCGRDGARVLTAAVGTQPDGLHLELTNETARKVHVTIEQDRYTAAGGTATPGTSEQVWGCDQANGPLRAVDGGDLREPPTFELVDAQGLWVSTELTECELPETSHPDYAPGAGGEQGDPLEIAARALEYELAPGDVVERGGYPEQDPPVFRGRRDGRTMATISLFDDGAGGWLQGETTTCADTPPSGSSGGEGSG